MNHLLLNYLKYLREIGVEFLPKSKINPSKEKLLDELRIKKVSNCKKCELWKTRTNIVFGEGNPHAHIVFVGEAPGEEEDKTGRPFVGKAGQLLTNMIIAMKLKREEAYICNALKCRPPNNRDPKDEEINACRPYLEEQIKIISPHIIITLGKFALFSLTGEKTLITSVHGQWREWRGIKILPTFHPSFLLRNPAWKKHAWADLKKVMREIGVKT